MTQDSSEQARAFVLSPFEESFDALYSGLLHPALEQAGYAVKRADSVIDQQNVLRDVVTGIDRADLIVADLTGLNPNVFYELGIAHGLGVPTVLITQSIEEVPFDLRTYRVQEYSTRFDVAEELKAKLDEIGRQHLRGEVSFGSPVSDFLPESAAAARLARTGPRIAGETRGRAPAQQAEGEEGEEGEDDGEGPKGFLDLFVEMEAAFEALPNVAEEIGEETAALGAKIEQHSAAIEDANAAPAGAGLSTVHRTAAMVAQDVSAYADRLKPLVTELGRQGNVLTDSALAWVARLDASDPDQHKQLIEFRDSLGELRDELDPVSDQIVGFRQTIAEAKGMTRKLDRATDRALGELDHLIDVLEVMEAFCARGIEIATQKVGPGPHAGATNGSSSEEGGQQAPTRPS